MNFRDAFDKYLLDTMSKVCPCTGSEVVPDADIARRIVDASGILPPHSRLENIKSAFTTEGVVGPPVYGDGIAEFQQGSRQHRFELARWPAFEFAIWVTPSASAWGHSFVRRAGVEGSVISGLDNLSRWSHVLTEVVRALGPPTESEEWFPWTAITYPTHFSDVSLCFVFGLLQCSEAHDATRT